MDKIVIIIIAIFFLISGFDFIRENKWGLGEKFKEGITSAGTLIISMSGIFAFSPLIGQVIGLVLIPVGKIFNIDPSVFPAMFLATDMGALGIAETISLNMEMYHVSGIIIASTLGATVSFSIPLALGLIKEEHHNDFYKGLMYGLVTVPLAPIVAAFMLKIDAKVMLINISPMLILTLILCLGMFKFRNVLMNFLTLLGKGIQKVSLVGLLAMGVVSILGLETTGVMVPIDETLGVAGRIALFLGGAYPMIDFITDKFSKGFKTVGEKLNINEFSVSSLLGSLASNIIIFKNFDKLDSNGRIICTAFSISAACVIGGQMGFVSFKAPDILMIYIISKLLAGVVAFILALIACNVGNKSDEVEVAEIASENQTIE